MFSIPWLRKCAVLLFSVCMLASGTGLSAQTHNIHLQPQSDISHRQSASAISQGNPPGASMGLLLPERERSDSRIAESGAAAIRKSPWLDITAFGAVGDGKIVSDSILAKGSTIVTTTTTEFSPSDLGKQFAATPNRYRNSTGQIYGTI